MLSRDHFSNYLKRHDKDCFIEVHTVNMIKESKLLKSLTLNCTELPQFSLKKDLVDNGYSLFAEEVISCPHPPICR